MFASKLPVINQIPTPGVLLPVCYFPPIQLYSSIAQNNTVVFETHETYVKQTVRNRTTILTANGPLRLTLPVKKLAGNHTRTEEIVIDYTSGWNKIHWRAITSAYSKSPFFLYYQDELEAVLMKPCNRLIDLNLQLIAVINRFLKIKSSLYLTGDFIKNYGEDITDLRYSKEKGTIQPPYYQVFSDRFAFVPDLSILDLLFNLGPEAKEYLLHVKVQGTQS